MKDLGYANGWRKTPEEIEKCRELKHNIDYDMIGKSLTKYTCKICQYNYKVDSSD
jgi:transposase-like protein